LLFKGQQLGKYKIGAPLGSGGFGTVYLAHDTWIDKKVAIKVPHRQNLDFGELLREPRLLASVNHPNIVAITTAEKQDGVFFIVMEYVPGRRSRTSSPRGALELTARSTSPARSATPSITRTARASSTATCARPTCWSARTTC
jgi:serine/threonine-protein kinase